MSCCARMEVSVLHVHRHSRTAAAADQACMRPPPRILRQSPRFRVNRVADLGDDIQPDPGLVVLVEAGARSEPVVTRQYVDDAGLVGTQTPNLKDGYRRGFRSGTARSHERSRLGVLKSRLHCCTVEKDALLQQSPRRQIQPKVRPVQDCRS